jgi:glc operon protein GlcG
MNRLVLMLAVASIFVTGIAHAQQQAAPPAQPLPTYGTPMTLDQAKKAMAAAEAEAAKNSWPMVIAIVDSTGHLLALHRMDNGSYGSIKIAIGKAQTAFEFRQPTKNYNDRLTAGTAPHLLTIRGATFIEGGIPIVAGGKIVGAIGVSGGTSTQDGQVAKAGADIVQ